MDLRTAINGPSLITEKVWVYCAVRNESANIIQVNWSIDMVKDCQIWTLATAAPYPTWTPRGGMGPSDFNLSGLIMKHLLARHSYRRCRETRYHLLAQTLDTWYKPLCLLGQILIVKWDYVEIWCVPSAARLSWRLLQRSQNKILDITACHCTLKHSCTLHLIFTLWNLGCIMRPCFKIIPSLQTRWTHHISRIQARRVWVFSYHW
jgi:hypothetical protein